MKYIILTIILAGCATTVEDKEWKDIYDSEDWKKKFDDCRDFLYIDDNSWHWCMQSRGYDMTQYEEKVANRKQELEQEKKDNTVIAIDTRYSNGKWTEQTTWYGSGKKITEFADKRKKTVEDS
tara:strand:- start:251 stop:619 length:369 start_codon:yes stop_codon:yes gene_type:complete